MPGSEERHPPGLGDADRRFIHRLAAHYAPPPLSAARRARFDRALEERLAGTSRRFLWLPAGALASAGLILWLAFPPLFAPRLTIPENFDGRSFAAGSRTLQATSPSTLLTLAYDQIETERETNAGLPDEYVALAEALEL